MGQGQSNEGGRALTTEEASHELVSTCTTTFPAYATPSKVPETSIIDWPSQALKFEQRCFTPLELYIFKDVFKSLADHQDHIAYLKEDTISRFLEIPDILGVSSILFQMVSYLGAFPFGEDAPVVLGFGQMIMVVVIMTERYQRVLKKGNRDRTKLLFRSLAVYDRRETHKENKKLDGLQNHKPAEAGAPQSHAVGFAVDEAMEDYDDDDDDLALAALEYVTPINSAPNLTRFDTLKMLPF
jgi:hypothetical protein